MFLNFFGRLILALAAIVVPATLLNATHPCCAAIDARVSLAGQLLIASPEIRDSNFDHAVILLVRHDQGGAMGFVINMPTEQRTVADILKLLGENDSNVKGKVQLFAGGPVQPEIGFVIHTGDYRESETIDVNGRALVTSSRQILRNIGNDKGPKKSLVVFGYAGWAAGQLEDEIKRRVWFTVSADQNLIFDAERQKLWDAAYAHRTQDL
jgi:putative transcriptional regulator